MPSRLRALRVVHPFPSFLNAALVFGIALVARGTTASAFLLAVGMLGIQFCIGAANDLHDARVDALSKPWKPLVAGDVSRRAATVVAISAALLGLASGVRPGTRRGSHGGHHARLRTGLRRLAQAHAMGVGVLLDRVRGLCRSTPGTAPSALPPRPRCWSARRAGRSALQLSNGLIDLDARRAAGVATLAARLGDRRSLAVIAALSLAVIHAAAWADVLAGPPVTARHSGGDRRQAWRLVGLASCRRSGSGPARGGLDRQAAAPGSAGCRRSPGARCARASARGADPLRTTMIAFSSRSLAIVRYLARLARSVSPISRNVSDAPRTSAVPPVPRSGLLCRHQCVVCGGAGAAV